MAMTIRLNDSLDQRLEEYSTRMGIPKNRVITQSLEEFLERAHQRSVAEATFTKVLERDRDLLERLADS